MIDEYMAAKLGCVETARDREELERRAKEKGIQVVEAEEHLGELKREIGKLQEFRNEQEQRLQNVRKVRIFSFAAFVVWLLL